MKSLYTKPVLHITWEYPPWVVGHISEELGRALPLIAKKIPVIVVVRGDVDGLLSSNGMKIYKVGLSVKSSPHVLSYVHVLNVDLVRGASRAIYENGASLVHAHDWVSSLAGLYISLRFRIPLVISVYSTEVTRAYPLTNLLSLAIYDVEKHCFAKADALVVKSEGMKEHLCRHYALKPSSIRVLQEAYPGFIKLYESLVRGN